MSNSATTALATISSLATWFKLAFSASQALLSFVLQFPSSSFGSATFAKHLKI